MTALYTRVVIDDLRGGGRAHTPARENLARPAREVQWIRGKPMTVKAIYENGVFKPKEPVALDERTEVELEVRSAAPTGQGETDPRGFVGLIKGGIQGLPVAAHHDKFLDQGQYAFLKAIFRPLAKASDWGTLSREQRIERFAQACRAGRPDFEDLWDDMDRIGLVWPNAFDYCTRAIEREAVARHG